jgi:hypothetical protein
MKKTYKKEPPTSKSRKKAEPSASITMIVDYVFLIALKSILLLVVQHIPKEILKESSQYINTIYAKLKDQILNTAMKDDTVMKREKVWGHVTNKIIDVLHPLIQATNIEQKPFIQVPIEEKLEGHRVSESDDPMNDIIPMGSSTLNHAIKAYAQSHSAEKKNSQIYWPKPLEINFLLIKDADDVATIYCKIGGLVIPCAMIDTGSDSSIFSDNIAELVEEFLGIKINRKKIHRLNGVASQSISIDTMDNVFITIGSGENTASIMDEFSVVPAEIDRNGNAKSLVILSTQWQYRVGWEPLIKGEFKVTCNGKTITIPLSVHKSQRNIFIVKKESEPIKKN